MRTFLERVNSLIPWKRKALFKELQKYGELTEMLDYINNMPVLFDSPEIRCDSRFFVMDHFGKFTVIPTGDLGPYYVVRSNVNKNKPEYRFCLTTPDGTNLQEIMCDIHRNALLLNIILKTYCPDFEKIESTFRTWSFPSVTDAAQKHIITQETVTLSNGKQLPAQEIIWCEHMHREYLFLYMLDGSVQEIQIGSNENEFKIVLALKDCIPHLMYGFNPEYMEIFKRNPAELMKLAKQKAAAMGTDASEVGSEPSNRPQKQGTFNNGSFIERVNKLKPQHQEPLFAQLSQYGSLSEVLDYIDHMQVLMKTDILGFFQTEIRLDSRFFVMCEDKDITVVPTGELGYYYITHGINVCGYPECVFGLDYSNSNNFYQIACKPDEEAMMFNIALKRHFRSFDLKKSEFKKWRAMTGRTMKECHYITPETIKLADGKQLPATEVIWCEQTYDVNDTELFILALYMLDGSVHELKFKTHSYAYLFALTLKDCIPHLLYGPSAEYEMLFRRNPAELMELAKKKRETVKPK